MNSGDFKYMGFLNQHYVFIGREGKNISFKKCRKDLIEGFKLDNDENINEWFKISFFQTKPLNEHDVGNEIFIISDMEIMK